MYVVDASVLAPLILLYGIKLRDIVLKYRFHILDLAVYEVCNAFWKECVKLHRIDKSLAQESCSLLVKLTEYLNLHRLLDLDAGSVVDVAVSNNITVYDASYIVLAMELGIPIASSDRDILEVAPKYGIDAYSLEEFVEHLRL